MQWANRGAAARPGEEVSCPGRARHGRAGQWGLARAAVLHAKGRWIGPLVQEAGQQPNRVRPAQRLHSVTPMAASPTTSGTHRLGCGGCHDAGNQWVRGFGQAPAFAQQSPDHAR